MQAVEEMDRGELEAEVEALRERLDDLEDQVDKQATNKVGRMTMNHLLSALLDVEIEDYSADPMQNRQHAAEFGELVSSLDQRLTKVEQLADEEQTLSNDSSVSNWQAIVEKAKEMQGHADHQAAGSQVKLFKKQVATACDVSERYAIDLIKQFGEEKQGARWQEYKRFETSRKTKGSNIQPTAIFVDLEVWG